MLVSDAAIESVQTTLPEWLLACFAIVTMFGDPWLVVVGLALVYWYSDRRQGAALYAGVLGGMALVLVLKATLGLPRPTVGSPIPTDATPAIVRPAYEQAVDRQGNGLPSGHAAIATLLWGSFGIVATGIRRSVRVVAVGAVVVLVASSRVILGVHYPIDVVAGVALGAAVLAGVVVISRSFTPVFPTIMAPAIIAALAAVFVYGPAVETVAVLGALVGGALGFVFATRPPTTPNRNLQFGMVGTVGLGGVGIASTAGTIGGLVLVNRVLQITVTMELAVVGIGTTALGAWIFAWPALAVKLHH